MCVFFAFFIYLFFDFFSLLLIYNSRFFCIFGPQDNPGYARCSLSPHPCRRRHEMGGGGRQGSGPPPSDAEAAPETPAARCVPGPSAGCPRPRVNAGPRYFRRLAVVREEGQLELTDTFLSNLVGCLLATRGCCRKHEAVKCAASTLGFGLRT